MPVTGEAGLTLDTGRTNDVAGCSVCDGRREPVAATKG